MATVRTRGSPAKVFEKKALSRAWPPEKTLREMLAEATDLQLGELLGYHRLEVSAMRAMLGVPPFSRGGSSIEKAKRRQQFIAKWRPRISEAGFFQVGSEGVQQSGEGDAGMNAITAPERKPAPPMTPGQLLVEIRRYHKTHHRWPTVAEMAVELDRHETTIREHSYRLVSQNLIDRASGPLVPTDLAAREEAPVTRTVWTKEQIEEHLRSLGVAPKSPPAKQAQDQSEEAVAMKDAVAKLPSAEVLQAEAEEYKRRGERFTKALADKYGVDPKNITNALYRARTGHPHGMPRGRPPASAQPETDPSTMTSEAPEAEQKATEPLEQGEGSTDQEPKQAQEPEITGGAAAEGEAQVEGAELQEASQQVEGRTTIDGPAYAVESDQERERQAKLAEAKSAKECMESGRPQIAELSERIGAAVRETSMLNEWRAKPQVEYSGPSREEVLRQMEAAVAVRAQTSRLVGLHLIPLLADEIHDDATLGRVVRRLMREGVA